MGFQTSALEILQTSTKTKEMINRLTNVLEHMWLFIRVMFGLSIYVTLGAIVGVYLFSIILPLFAYILFDARIEPLILVYTRFCNKIGGIEYSSDGDDLGFGGIFIGTFLLALALAV